MMPKWITDLSELEKKATPGPWYVRYSYSPDGSRNDVAIVAHDSDEEAFALLDQDNLPPYKDCELIVDSRNAVPKLISALETAVGALRELREFAHADACEVEDLLDNSDMTGCKCGLVITDKALAEIEGMGENC